jgi:hypothetical protein
MYKSSDGTLTNSAGVFLSDMHSTCNMSKNKTPQVLANVGSLWFGELNENAYKYMCPSADSCSFATELVAESLRGEINNSFNNPLSVARVSFAGLIIEESNKCDNPLKVKIAITSQN